MGAPTLCSALASSGVAVEVSSAGLRKPVRELSPMLLGMLHEAGVGFTTASDAHRVQQIGDGLGGVDAQLRQLGVDEVTTFTRRQRQQVPID